MSFSKKRDDWTRQLWVSNLKINTVVLRQTDTNCFIEYMRSLQRKENSYKLCESKK